MLQIRPATPTDIPTILRFVRKLAEYERERDKVVATEADLLRDGFALAPDGTPLATPIRFYRRLGATAQEDWRIMRLSEDALCALAMQNTTPQAMA